MNNFNLCKKNLILLITASFFLVFTSTIYSQLKRDTLAGRIIQEKLKSKIGSSTLYEIYAMRSRKSTGRLSFPEKGPEFLQVFLYFMERPTPPQIEEITSLGVKLYTETWTPPIHPGHPLGFILASVPVDTLIPLLRADYIRRVDTAERTSFPQNNISAQAVHAANLWAGGWTGEGIRIAILDSGLDTDPDNSDLPQSLEKKDYSAYPTLDNNVENSVTGHGTHVTATALGRGIYSTGNTGNGGGQYKGTAPDADLVFLKIANDTDGTASSTAIINALDAAINIYNADIITMSYGGWNDYHDGSLPVEQKVDWCYSQGVPVFISAGNDAAANRHYSGTVNARSYTDFIGLDISTPAGDSTLLKFNLVWYDGSEFNDLFLKYYDKDKNELTDITFYQTAESSRGTESLKSNYNKWVKPGEDTFYLRVINNSSTSQIFHIYEDTGERNRVTFTNADPFYTISSPATADYAFAVGSWTTRSSWTDYSGSGWTYGETLNDISSFSSCGPRVDGVQKPDIVAPGSAIISLRDRDIYTSPNSRWIDDDGTTGSGDAHYYIMQGTSMACPVTAGCAALLMDRDPTLTPSELYSILRSNAVTDAYTGVTPNNTWGYGKLDAAAAMSGITVQVKVFLEGPYNTDTHAMKTDLKNTGLIPLSSPYNEAPISVSTIPSDVVDWILVQLKTTADGEVAASKSVFLDPDGYVVDIDGSNRDILFDVSEGDYYIVVKHRNHLKIMSSSPITLYSDHSVLYDFTDSVEKSYGTSSTKQVEGNVYAMYSGDANGDGFITSVDLNTLWRPNNGTYGYKGADMNMDTFINAHDKNKCYKKNMGKGSAVQ